MIKVEKQRQGYQALVSYPGVGSDIMSAENMALPRALSSCSFQWLPMSFFLEVFIGIVSPCNQCSLRLPFEAYLCHLLN